MSRRKKKIIRFLVAYAMAYALSMIATMFVLGLIHV